MEENTPVLQVSPWFCPGISLWLEPKFASPDIQCVIGSKHHGFLREAIVTTIVLLFESDVIQDKGKRNNLLRKQY
jgi:hypothetical protein